MIAIIAIYLVIAFFVYLYDDEIEVAFMWPLVLVIVIFVWGKEALIFLWDVAGFILLWPHKTYKSFEKWVGKQ